MEAVANDTYPWVNFSFYPCPVGADTPAGCKANPGPFQMNPDCCVNDKFEACMVAKLQCFPGSTVCPFDTQRRMAKFLSCFEGASISEGECPGNAQTCATAAGLDQYYTAIQACTTNAIAMKNAAANMTAACKAQNPSSWPTVLINGVLTCPDDPCMMPLLPKLCKAYRSTPKPASCQALEKAEQQPVLF